MIGARLHLGIPADLRIQMGVEIDESGSDDFAGGIDHLRRFDPGEIAKARDAIAVDRHVCPSGLRASAVDD